MKQTVIVLAAALLLAACVNVHVHFPAAPAEKKAADGNATGKPAP